MLKFFDVENKFRAGSLMLKRTGSVLLMTIFVLLSLMMMKTNPILMPETSSVMVYPLMMTTNPMIMKTISDEDKFPDAEDEFYAAVSYDDEDQTCGDDDQLLDAADRFSDVMEDTSSALEKAPYTEGESTRNNTVCMMTYTEKPSYEMGMTSHGMIKRKFVRHLDPILRRTAKPRFIVEESAKTPHTVKTESADEAPAVQGDDVPVGRHAVQDPGHQDGGEGHDQLGFATQGQGGHASRGADVVSDQGNLSGGAGQVPVDEGTGVAKDVNGGGAVPVPDDEGGDVPKDVDGEGDVHV